MIRIILLLAFLLIGLIVGPNLVGEKGYVLIALKDTTIEMSVISLGIMVFFAVIGFLILEWAIKRVIAIITGSKHWLGSWGERRRQKQFTIGMQAMAEGDLLRAQKALTKVKNADFDGLNLLASADIEAKLGNETKALAYWDQAAHVPGSALAAKLNMARHAITQGRGDEAVNIIERLTVQDKQKPHVIEIWAGALAASGQWHELHKRLDHWKKALGDRYEHWLGMAAQGDFAEIAQKDGANELMSEWQKLSRSQKKNVAEQKAFILQLFEQNMHEEAQKHLIAAQKSGPHLDLLPLFKQLVLDQPIASVKILEKWIKKDQSNPQLYSALAHVAFHSGDVELAEKALNSALEHGQCQDDILLLAEIKAGQEQAEEALKLYKQGVNVG
ncbi:MAG: heme biosynthesis HemY N-terminal domain-containing protein [Glaciecola sp.]|jgi:HemY protein